MLIASFCLFYVRFMFVGFVCCLFVALFVCRLASEEFVLPPFPFSFCSAFRFAFLSSGAFCYWWAYG
jgi:hypothetical protein